MSDKHTYQFMPDAEMLKRFYDGKLSESEMLSFSNAIANDEFLKEAFAGLDRKEFDTVEAIALSTNSRLKNRFGTPPLSMNWEIWLSVFIGLIVVTTFLMMYDFGSDKNQNQVASNDNTKEKKQNHKKREVHERPKTVTVHSFYMDESESTSIEKETSMNFKSEKSEKNSESKSDNKQTNNTTENNIIDEKTNQQTGPNENKNEEKVIDQKNNNQTSVDPNIKKTYQIRCADAGVLTVANLAEMEANAESRKEVDPRNINIGDPSGSNKKSSYKLEDMPQYKGGDEALARYVKGKLALKSYKITQSYISTIAEFDVNPKGKVENITFQNELEPTIEKDIKQIFSELVFTPGKKSGKKGTMHYMMALVYE